MEFTKKTLMHLKTDLVIINHQLDKTISEISECSRLLVLFPPSVRATMEVTDLDKTRAPALFTHNEARTEKSS
jgi:hypothetical protein